MVLFCRKKVKKQGTFKGKHKFQNGKKKVFANNCRHEAAPTDSSFIIRGKIGVNATARKGNKRIKVR